jgi:hypothetical protein
VELLSAGLFDSQFVELGGDIFDGLVILRGEGETGALGEGVITSLVPCCALFRHSERAQVGGHWRRSPILYASAAAATHSAVSIVHLSHRREIVTNKKKKPFKFKNGIDLGSYEF